MAKAENHRLLNIVFRHLGSPVQCGVGHGGPVCHNVATQTVNSQKLANLGDLPCDLVRKLDVLQPLLRSHDLLLQLAVLGRVLFSEDLGGVRKILAALHDLDSQLRLPLRPDHGVHAEAVQELRSQLSFLGIPTADEDELSRMAHTDTLPLHVVPSACGAVEQDVHQVVVEEIHLVDVKDAAVCLGEQTRFECLLTLCEGLFNIDRAAHPVLRGTQWQVNHRHLPLHHRQRLTILQPQLHLVAHQLILGRRGVVGVIRHAIHLGKKVHQGPDGRCLAGATVTHDHHPADLWIDHVEDECQLHLGLSDDGCEGKYWPRLLILRDVCWCVRHGCRTEAHKARKATSRRSPAAAQASRHAQA
mmetsp:Transcript_19949/g.43508  ORF Transcript_19949/g.43508 Transcript_19949/m.43508 type:complete len:359 (+) Transcript_19949:143-1219(+)